MSDIDAQSFIFFFQAEDGIRDWSVTGVQTCALPISQRLRQQLLRRHRLAVRRRRGRRTDAEGARDGHGRRRRVRDRRASCREREEITVVADTVEKIIRYVTVK